MTEQQPPQPKCEAPAKGEDASILNGWIDRHTHELFGFAYRLTGDHGVAEDLVQETFYEAWRHRRPLRSIREPRAWLFVVLRRRYGKLRRYENRRPVFLPLAGREASPPDRHEPGSDTFEISDALQRGLNELTELYKLPLLMVFLEGLSCAEAAARLDVPLGTVLSRLHRGRAQLRAVMREQAESPSRRSSGADSCQQGDRGEDSPRLRIGGV